MSSMLIHKPRRVWQPPTQGSPGGYRSHGTQGTQLSSADVPREAAAVEGTPLEFVPVRLEFRTIELKHMSKFEFGMDFASLHPLA